MRGDRPGFTFFKPLTTLVILFGAAFLVQPGGGTYRALVVIALAASLAGDVLLVLPAERFAAGLGAFLLAHLVYVAAFSLGTPFTARQLPALVPWILVCGGATAFVRRGLGRYRAAVVCYTAAIAATGWRAAVRGQSLVVPRASFVLALAGATLFVVSDVVLAIRRFRSAFRGAHELELAAYWAAQLLIALSIRA